MKNYVPNELINQRKPLILMMRKLLLLLVFALYAANISAQDSRSTSPGIMEVKAFIASLRGNDVVSRGSSSFSPAQNVEDLLYKLQPSQYYYNSGAVKTYGEKPKHLFTDKQSLSGLNNPALLKNNIDIVTIRINSANDLIGTIDLSVFSNFKSLKYVHIVSTVPATASQFANMVSNADERLSVFYSVENGEKNQ